MPDWLREIWPQLCWLRQLLTEKYETATENKIRQLIMHKVPAYSTDLLQVNLNGDSIHMEFLRAALQYGDRKFFLRAMQYGRHRACFPLEYDWAVMSASLRKYVIYCFVHHAPPGRCTLPLLPCSRMQFIDYLEWLAHNGINAGWSSIRHFAGALLTWSNLCGHGGIVDGDPEGYAAWQKNFAANVTIIRKPKGGDLPLRPVHLRLLAQQAFCSSSPFDKRMRMACSNMWFTALRIGHLCPGGRTELSMQHLLQWPHIGKYDAKISEGVKRQALHYRIPSAKNRQKNKHEDWTTASRCFCEGLTAPADVRRLMRHLCPVCTLESWRRVAPVSQYVCCNMDGTPVLQTALNRDLRRGLRLALSGYITDEATLDAIVTQLSARSWRSGAATTLITDGTPLAIAASFMGHGDLKVTKKYYHKAGDDERLKLVPALSKGLIPPGAHGMV